MVNVLYFVLYFILMIVEFGSCMIFTPKRLSLNARRRWGSNQGFTAVPLLTLALSLHFCSKIEENSYIVAFLKTKRQDFWHQNYH